MAQQIGFGFHPFCAGSLNFAQFNSPVAGGHDQALFRSAHSTVPGCPLP